MYTIFVCHSFLLYIISLFSFKSFFNSTLRFRRIKYAWEISSSSLQYEGGRPEYLITFTKKEQSLFTFGSKLLRAAPIVILTLQKKCIFFPWQRSETFFLNFFTSNNFLSPSDNRWATETDKPNVFWVVFCWEKQKRKRFLTFG